MEGDVSSDEFDDPYECQIGECFLEIFQKLRKFSKKRWEKCFSVIDYASPEKPNLLTLYEDERKEKVKKIFYVKNCRIYNSVYELRKKKRKNVASTLLVFFEIANTNRKKKKKKEIKFFFRFKEQFTAEEFIFEMVKAGASLIDDSFVLRKSLKQRKKIFEKKKSVVLRKMSKLRGFDKDDFDIKESIEVLSNRVLFKHLYLSGSSSYSGFRWRKLPDEEKKHQLLRTREERFYRRSCVYERTGSHELINFFLIDTRVHEGLMKNGKYNIKEKTANPVLEYDGKYVRNNFLKSVYYFLWLMSWEESMSKLSRDVFRYSILSFWDSCNAGKKIECVLGVVWMNYFLDWNKSNLVIPLALSSKGGSILTGQNLEFTFPCSFSLGGSDLYLDYNRDKYDCISFAIEELSSILHDYNTKYEFLEIGEERTKENERTKADFFGEIFGILRREVDDPITKRFQAYKEDRLGRQEKTEEGCGMNFFRNLIQKGKSGMKFKPHKEFVEFFKEILTKYFRGCDIKGELHFSSHFHLDELCHKLSEDCLDVRTGFCHEWSLFEAFDRWFWMNHFLFPEEERYMPKPLLKRSAFDPYATGCPFHDPRGILLKLNKA